MRRLFLICLTLALPRAASAQTHPLAGKWNVSVETPVPPGNGAALTINRKGLLLVTQAGDSLIATMTLEPVQGMPTPKADRLVAVQRDGSVSFIKSAEASLSGNGDVLSRTATMTYVFAVRADTLVGSINIEVPGIPDIPSRPITGARAK